MRFIAREVRSHVGWMTGSVSLFVGGEPIVLEDRVVRRWGKLRQYGTARTTLVAETVDGKLYGIVVKEQDEPVRKVLARHSRRVAVAVGCCRNPSDHIHLAKPDIQPDPTTA